MKTAVIKRSITFNGQKTSISLENEFYEGLLEISANENIPLPTLVEQIDTSRNTCNLSSAIRLFVFNYFRSQIRKRKFGKHQNYRSWSSAVKRRALQALAR